MTHLYVQAHPVQAAVLCGTQGVEKFARSLGENIGGAARRVASVAGSVFTASREVCSFPLRFFGAKDWSIPGAAWRLGVGVFNRCVHGTPIKKEQIFPSHSGYHHVPQEELLPEEVPQFFKHLFAYGAVDWHRADDWMGPLGFSSVIPEGLMAELQQIKGANFIERDGFIFENKTQLKVGIFRNGEQFVVAFGSLGCVYEDNVKRTKDVVRRGFASALGALGFVPSIYANADKFVAALLQNPEFRSENPPAIEFAGLSLGGSLASYVGLKHGVKAVCMNSYTLGAGLQKKLGKAARARADELITHIIVQGDRFLADQHPMVKALDKAIGRLGIRTPGNLGKKHYIRNAYQGSIPAHRYAYESAMFYLGLDGGKHPHEQEPGAFEAS